MYLTQHHVVPFVVLNVVWIFKENVTVASSWGRIFMLILKQKEKLKKKKRKFDLWTQINHKISIFDDKLLQVCIVTVLQILSLDILALNY